MSSIRPTLKRQKSDLLNDGLPTEAIGVAKVKDWKDAYSKNLSQINEQKKAITKLSKFCLGALSAVDRLESQIVKSKNGTKDQNLLKSIHEDHLAIKQLLNEFQSKFENKKTFLSSDPEALFQSLMHENMARIKEELQLTESGE